MPEGSHPFAAPSRGAGPFDCPFSRGPHSSVPDRGAERDELLTGLGYLAALAGA
jgi:hypothetical protein